MHTHKVFCVLLSVETTKFNGMGILGILIPSSGCHSCLCAVFCRWHWWSWSLNWHRFGIVYNHLWWWTLSNNPGMPKVNSGSGHSWLGSHMEHASFMFSIRLLLQASSYLKPATKHRKANNTNTPHAQTSIWHSVSDSECTTFFNWDQLTAGAPINLQILFTMVWRTCQFISTLLIQLVFYNIAWRPGNLCITLACCCICPPPSGQSPHIPTPNVERHHWSKWV